MITSTTSSDRAGRPDPATAPAQPPVRPAAGPADRISTDNVAFLRAELLRQPEIRPEVVARARLLLADPTYPPPAVVRDIAQQILSAPDRSEDES